MQIPLENVITALHNMCVLAAPSSEDHSAHTSHMAVRVGERLGLSSAELRLLRFGANVHDLGKLFIDHGILYKPGKLNKAQRAQIEKHSELGFESIEPIRAPHEIGDAILYHHEHWDGSGYPRKLKGEEIPLAARIVCIADMWDALNSDRPYRPRYDSVKALDIMTQHAAWFDPRLFAIFLTLVRDDGPRA